MKLPEIHPDKPVTLDGFCFDETYGLTASDATRMGKTGYVFTTDFRGICEGKESNFGGNLIASSWEEARKEADRRGLGETIRGQLREVIEA